MSSALIESPTAASQLYFSWLDNAEAVPASAMPPVRKTTQSCIAAPQRNLREEQPVAAAVAEPVATHLSFTLDGRIAKPVKMGSFMIKLLKRYGITDDEIAEGVANYARKHQVQRSA